MEVQINGDRRGCPEGSTVAELLEMLGTAPNGIAIALDGEVVRRGEWDVFVVPAGAKLEILTAVQGG